MVEMKDKRYNSAISLLRLLFAGVVLLYHAAHLGLEKQYLLFPGGYLAVEFFLIVSGALMAQSVYRIMQVPGIETGEETASFMKRKISSLFWPYSICFVVGFCGDCILRHRSFPASLVYALRSFWTFLMSEMAGLDAVGYRLEGAWYLSAMLLVMAVLFPLLLSNFALSSKIICPLIALFSYGFIFQRSQNLSVVRDWLGVAYIGVIRAAAGLSLGVVAFCLAQALQKKELTLAAKVVLSVMEIALYGISLICMNRIANTPLDFSVALLLTVAVTITLSQVTYLSRAYDAPRMARWMAKYSLCLYLVHPTLYVWIGNRLPVSGAMLLTVYVIISIVFAGVVMLLSTGVAALQTAIKKTLIINE